VITREYAKHAEEKPNGGLKNERTFYEAVT
jgi:hypothetical protein